MSRLAICYWALLIGNLVAFEIFAWQARTSAIPTLTRIIIRFVPWPIALLVWIWITLHFISAYGGHK